MPLSTAIGSWSVGDAGSVDAGRVSSARATWSFSRCTGPLLPGRAKAANLIMVCMPERERPPGRRAVGPHQRWSAASTRTDPVSSDGRRVAVRQPRRQPPPDAARAREQRVGGADEVERRAASASIIADARTPSGTARARDERGVIRSVSISMSATQEGDHAGLLEGQQLLEPVGRGSAGVEAEEAQEPAVESSISERGPSAGTPSAGADDREHRQQGVERAEVGAEGDVLPAVEVGADVVADRLVTADAGRDRPTGERPVQRQQVEPVRRIGDDVGDPASKDAAPHGSSVKVVANSDHAMVTRPGWPSASSE